jgi:hypothetical protein
MVPWELVVTPAGIVLRDHNGAIIASACHQLNSCRDALQAELSAV